MPHFHFEHREVSLLVNAAKRVPGSEALRSKLGEPGPGYDLDHSLTHTAVAALDAFLDGERYQSLGGMAIVLRNEISSTLPKVAATA